MGPSSVNFQLWGPFVSLWTFEVLMDIQIIYLYEIYFSEAEPVDEALNIDAKV